MKRAFVAGATGYTGREVVRQLCERGVQTVAHIRPGSRSSARWTPNFREWGAALAEIPWQPDALAAELARLAPDLVFGLIGTTRAAAKKDAVGDADIYDAVDYKLTRMLIDAAKTIEPGPHFVYLSSVGASTTTRSRYLAARGRAEADLVASGLPYTIARPSFITGAGREDGRLGERTAATVANGLLGVAGVFGARKLRDRYRSIDNVGLAAALIAAASDPGCKNTALEGDELQHIAAPS
jgi:nucleoside-diphosphate-sugar epimerase